jgi:hypothetical protein
MGSAILGGIMRKHVSELVQLVEELSGRSAAMEQKYMDVLRQNALLQQRVASLENALRTARKRLGEEYGPTCEKGNGRVPAEEQQETRDGLGQVPPGPRPETVRVVLGTLPQDGVL